MAVWCHRCGAESRVEAGYRVERTLLGARRRYCPLCDRERQVEAIHSLVRNALLMPFLALACIGFGALGAARSGWLWERVGWGLLNLWLFVVFLAALELPHELGHALAARTLGLRIFWISVGLGRKVFERTLLGASSGSTRCPGAAARRRSATRP